MRGPEVDGGMGKRGRACGRAGPVRVRGCFLGWSVTNDVAKAVDYPSVAAYRAVGYIHV